jgi:hypothetical protein
MRLSVEKGDPGELPYGMLRADHKNARIFLDDKEQRYCITADDSEGYIKRHLLSEGGRPVVIAGAIQTEEVRGTVRIEVEARE